MAAIDRLLRPFAATASRTHPLLALTLACACALAAVVEVAAPDRVVPGAVVVLPVLAASWTLRWRWLAGVVALVPAVEVAAVGLGRIGVVAAGGRIVAIVVVAGVTRLAARTVTERGGGPRLLEAGRPEAALVQIEQCLHDGVEVALGVGRSMAPEQVAERLMAIVASGVRADQATLARVEGGDLVIEAVQGGLRPDAAARRFPRTLAGAVPELDRAMATGAAVMAGRLRVGPEAGALAPVLPAGRHTVSLPCVADGRLTHLVVVGRDDRGAFDDADVAQLRRMAAIVVLVLAQTLERVRAERERRAASFHSVRLEQAIEAAQDIGTAEELSDVLERVLRRAVAVAHADRGSISRLEGEWLIAEHDHRRAGDAPKPLVRRELAKSVMAAEAIRTRRPVPGPITAGSVGPDGMAWLERAGVLHALQCPLVVEDEVVGVLGLARNRDVPFTEVEVEALLPFAKLAGLVLRNARRLADAQQAGRARTAFLHLAAHELRTPLAVIRGYLALLEDGTYEVPTRTREEAVETLVAKAHELETLVGALVTAARLDGGSLPCSPVDLDVTAAVLDAVERMRPRLRLEGGDVRVVAPDPGPVAGVDRGHVTCILDNLLNNALTYSSPPAEITVEVRPGPPVEIAVSDRGHGIPADQHERVFERFRRVDVGPRSSSAGLGLGLTISRDLARLNGGALVLERSAPGRGSVFVLRLPG